MKKYLLLLFIFLIPTSVKADSIAITCSPKPVILGNNITCLVTGNSSTSINGISTTFTLSSGLTYVSYTKNSEWDGSFNSSSYKLSEYISSANAKTGSFSIGTLVVKANTSQESYTIGATSTEYSDTSYNAITVANSSDTITLSSGDNTLASLSVSAGTLSPAFNSSTTSYTVSNYTSSTITISATKSNANATISGTGTKTVNYGDNTYSIVVSAQDGSTKTYSIKVTRVDTRSSDATLKTLSVSVGTLTPVFSSSTLSYTINNYTANEITISATANNSLATVTGTGKKTVASGTNTFSIIVKAENGTTKTYKVIVKKVQSDDVRLQYLVVSNTSIVYSDDVNEYNATVANNITSVVINGTEKSIYSTLTGTGSKNLVVGKNTFTLTITSQSGEKRTITINITRSEATSSSSAATISNGGVKSLTVNGTSFTLDESVLSYDITVDANTTSIPINYVANDNYSIVVIGNDDLVKSNNIVTIKVINTVTNDIKTYTINVNKDSSSSSTQVVNNDKSNSYFEQAFLVISVICVLETVTLIYIFYKKYAKKKIQIEQL